MYKTVSYRECFVIRLAADNPDAPSYHLVVLPDGLHPSRDIHVTRSNTMQKRPDGEQYSGMQRRSAFRRTTIWGQAKNYFPVVRFKIVRAWRQLVPGIASHQEARMFSVRDGAHRKVEPVKSWRQPTDYMHGLAISPYGRAFNLLACSCTVCPSHGRTVPQLHPTSQPHLAQITDWRYYKEI
jgi:hypothetical protein